MNNKLIIFNVLFLLTNLCQGHIYTRCDNYIQLDQCIDNPFCQWCNTINNTSICRANTECFYNSTECVSSNSLNNMCFTLNFFINLALLFILLASINYISLFTKKILDSYFDIPGNNGDGFQLRLKQKGFILTLINLLLFVPPIVFWIIGNIAFLYYFMFIMILILIMGCSEKTTYYYKYKTNEKNKYEQIN
jgi:uncharacterized membrane protein YhaH (DUF805 family)